MKKIPVYNIQTISCKSSTHGLFGIYPFEEHLKNIDAIHFPHRHDFYYLLFITSGKGTHTIDFKTYNIENNQMFFMSPGQAHQWDIEPRAKGYTLFFDKALFHSINFRIEQEWSFFHNFFDNAMLLVPKQKQQQLIEVFELLLKENHIHEKSHEAIIRNLISALLYKINDILFAERKITEPKHFDVIRKFDLLLDKYFTENHLLSFYAEKLNISPNYLNALCHKTLDKSAKQLINERLLLEAKRLLSHSNLNVNEITDYLNFTTSSYFIRFFKKSEGITPQHFKTKNS